MKCVVTAQAGRYVLSVAKRIKSRYPLLLGTCFGASEHDYREISSHFHIIRVTAHL